MMTIEEGNEEMMKMTLDGRAMRQSGWIQTIVTMCKDSSQVDSMRREAEWVGLGIWACICSRHCFGYVFRVATAVVGRNGKLPLAFMHQVNERA